MLAAQPRLILTSTGRLKVCACDEIEFTDFVLVSCLEIYEQPEAVARALNYGGRIFGDDNAKLGGMTSFLFFQFFPLSLCFSQFLFLR
jgi:hypothetical protein